MIVVVILIVVKKSPYCSYERGLRPFRTSEKIVYFGKFSIIINILQAQIGGETPWQTMLAGLMNRSAADGI